jgi:hypothetical protein
MSVDEAIEVLVNNGYIRHFWCDIDLQQQANEDIGRDLTDEELYDVKKLLEDIDCNIGINWDTISCMISEVVKED